MKSERRRICRSAAFLTTAVLLVSSGCGGGGGGNSGDEEPEAAAWRDEQLLEFDDVGENLLPEVAADGAGNAIAVWERRTAGASYVQASRYTPGAGWGVPVQIGRCGICDAAGLTSGPEIAMDSTGNATVVWSRLALATKANVYSVRFD